MKNLFIILSLSVLLLACGKDNSQTEIVYVTDNSSAATTYPYHYCGTINIAWGGVNPYVLTTDDGTNYSLLQGNESAYNQLDDYYEIGQACVYSSTAALNGQFYVYYVGTYQSSTTTTTTTSSNCNCPTAYYTDAVCGTDNITYASVCYAQCAGVGIRSYSACAWMLGI